MPASVAVVMFAVPTRHVCENWMYKFRKSKNKLGHLFWSCYLIECELHTFRENLHKLLQTIIFSLKRLFLLKITKNCNHHRRHKIQLLEFSTDFTINS